jgi:excisionase family DNA binding protein
MTSTTLHTLPEAAHSLRVRVRTVRRLVDGGGLASVHVGRRCLISQRAIDEYIGAHETVRRARRAA